MTITIILPATRQHKPQAPLTLRLGLPVHLGRPAVARWVACPHCASQGRVRVWDELDYRGLGFPACGICHGQGRLHANTPNPAEIPF
jgi:hypothetical protein